MLEFPIIYQRDWWHWRGQVYKVFIKRNRNIHVIEVIEILRYIPFLTYKEHKRL